MSRPTTRLALNAVWVFSVSLRFLLICWVDCRSSSAQDGDNNGHHDASSMDIYSSLNNHAPGGGAPSHNFNSHYHQVSGGLLQPPVANSKCEQITIPLCTDIEYNMTVFPNLLNHQKQEDASVEVHQFLPLVKVKCSPDLKLFLCTMYAPVCTVLDEPIKPCRHLCQSAKNGCESLMNKFGFPWPESFKCENFPEGVLCVGENKTSSSHHREDSSVPKLSSNNNQQFNLHNLLPPSTLPKSMVPVSINEQRNQQTQQNSIGVDIDSLPDKIYSTVLDQLMPPAMRKNLLASGGGSSAASFECKAPWSTKDTRENTEYKVRIGDEVVLSCALSCQDVIFDGEQRQILRVWTAVWALVCLVSTLFTVATYAVDAGAGRFKYPERPIIFLSFCCMVVSAVFLVGFALDNRVACVTPVPAPSSLDLGVAATLRALGKESSSMGMRQWSPIIAQGTKNSGCTVLAMIYYYFGASANVWWVNVTITWFLASGLKWGSEAIERNAHLLHLTAWGLPALLMIAVLVTHSIDGDVYTGICSVGNWDAWALNTFVLLPLVVCLVLGLFFLAAGVVSMLKIRKFMKHDGTKIEKLERLMMKITAFSAMYIIPTVVVIFCYAYQAVNLDSWLSSWLHPKICTGASATTEKCRLLEDLARHAPRAEFLVFMIKYACILAVGSTNLIWMWSPKTLKAWRRFFGCVPARHLPLPTQPPPQQQQQFPPPRMVNQQAPPLLIGSGNGPQQQQAMAPSQTEFQPMRSDAPIYYAKR